MTDRCTNCDSPGADPYDFQLRSNPSTEVYLCEDCHAALDQEFIWTD